MLNNFNYTKAEKERLLNSIGIVCDTQEKKNSHITDWFDKKKIQYKKQSLEYGDYTYYIPKNEELNIPRDLHFHNDFVIERKANIDEISGNFASDRARIEKEFAICPSKIKLLIEGEYQDMVDGNYKANYGAKACVGTLWSFSDRYNIDVMFNPRKDYSGHLIYWWSYYNLRNNLK